MRVCQAPVTKKEDAYKDIAKEEVQGLPTTKSIQVKQRTIVYAN